MDSKQLYTAVLGIQAPWDVDQVDMDMARQEVAVHVGHAPGSRFRCPRCERELAVFDHAAERRWRHLDTCQFLTYLVSRPPRVNCPEHGKLQVTLPWEESGSRFTAMFEALAIDVLLAANVKRAAALLRLTWDEAWGVMDRAVYRGRMAKKQAVLSYVGVDEKAIAKGHQYMTVVCDLKESTVEYVGEGRNEASLGAYYGAFTEKQCASIEAVSMDMCQAYVNATTAAVPQAEDKIVFDRFHIMQNMLAALDLVRRRENKQLYAAGDDSLKRTKYLWLRSTENLTDPAWQRLHELRETTLKTARAWALKENLRVLWDFPDKHTALDFFKRWYFRATHSRLRPVIDAARTIKRHLHNVLTYYDHRITNAVAESINSKIATVQKRACGFRNRDHFKIAIYFHCGGLHLYPARATPGKV